MNRFIGKVVDKFGGDDDDDKKQQSQGKFQFSSLVNRRTGPPPWNLDLCARHDANLRFLCQQAGSSQANNTRADINNSSNTLAAVTVRTYLPKNPRPTQNVSSPYDRNHALF